MPRVREDEKFFYVQGSRGSERKIAKSALSEAKRNEYASMVKGKEPKPLEQPKDFRTNPNMENIISLEQLELDAPVGAQSSLLDLGKTQSLPTDVPVAQTTSRGMNGLGLDQLPGQPNVPKLGEQRIPLSTEPVLAGETVQTQVTKGVDLTDRKKSIEDEFEVLKTATQKAAELEAEQIKAQNEVMQRYELDVAQDEYKAMMIRENRTQAIAEGRAKIEEEQAKVDEFEFKDFYRGSTGRQVLAGIMIGLGEAAQVLAGRSGPSAALTIIDNAIQRDIAQQKAELAKMQGGVQTKRNLLADLKNQFDDEEEAVLADIAMLYGRAEKKVQQIANSYQDQKSLINAQQLAAELGLKREEALSKLDQLSADKATVTTMQKFAMPEELQKMSDDKRKAVIDLSKTIENNDKIGKLSEINRHYQNFQTAKKSPGAAGSIAMIISYAKALDPASVVREGEQVMIARSGGIWESLKAQLNAAQGDKPLTTSQIKSLETQMKGFVKNAEEAAEPEIAKYKRQAEAFGAPWELVFGISQRPNSGAQAISQTFQPME